MCVYMYINVMLENCYERSVFTCFDCMPLKERGKLAMTS